MTKENLQGCLWMLVSVFAAASLSIGVREAGDNLHSMQITFVRCIIGLIIILPWIYFWDHSASKKNKPDYRSPFSYSPQWKLLVLRGLLMTGAMNFGFYSLTKIPLATVTVLFFTAPLFVTLIAGPCLNEEIGWRRWLATTLGFAGAFVSLNPETSDFNWVLLAPFAASLMFAISLIIGKHLSKTESANVILLYTSTVTTIGSFVPAMLVWTHITFSTFFLTFGVAVFALIRTYADIRAYAAGEASFIAPFSYLRLVFVCIGGYLFFGEVPETTVYWGGAIIIVSSIYIAHRETTHKRSISSPSAEPGGD